MSIQPRRSPAAFDGERPLTAVLEVEPAAGANCALAEEAPNATSVTQTTARRQYCTRCVSAAVVDDDDGDPETKYLSSELTEQCIRKTIDRFECVVDIDAVEDGALVVSITIRDRDVLNEMLTALRESGATVRLRRITSDDTVDAATLELDAMAITDKQREAATLAVDRGYYEKPRRATLQDLADDLGISKSAVSQRLNAVEQTLVRQLVA